MMMKTAVTLIVGLLLAAGSSFVRGAEAATTEPSEQRGRERAERLIRRVEPSGKGDPARLTQYIEFFKSESVDDPRLFLFEVMADGMVLRGNIEFPEHKEALFGLLDRLGLKVRDETELLVATRMGVVTATRTFVRASAVAAASSDRRETLTECVQGDVVFLLKQAGDQALCHATDGYIGYISASDVKWLDDAPVATTRPSARHADDIERVVATAQSLLGVKYVWGGLTRDGCDCSGLVSQAFKSVNINLPRDANQQFLVGRLVATRWNKDGLRRGDTLYFLGRRGGIHHTALYIGDGKYIEATSPVAKITSLRPDDPEYDERRANSFCFGKRILE